MKTSDQIGELATALSKAQGEMKHAIADAKNPHFKSLYADISSVLDVVKEPLSKNGLSFVQFPTTENGKTALTSRLMHSSGQWMEDTIELYLDKSTMQGLGSALTYARRYSLSAILGIAEADDDGNEAEKHPAAVPAKPKQRFVENDLSPTPPDDMNQVPSWDEFQETLSPMPESPTPQQAGDFPASQAQGRLIWARIKGDLKLSDEEGKALIKKISGKDHSRDLLSSDVQKILKHIDGVVKLPKPVVK